MIDVKIKVAIQLIQVIKYININIYFFLFEIFFLRIHDIMMVDNKKIIVNILS